jgi:hypothetical protein
MNTKQLIRNKYFNFLIFWWGLSFGVVYEKDDDLLHIMFLCFYIEVKCWEFRYKHILWVVFVLFCLLLCYNFYHIFYL